MAFREFETTVSRRSLLRGSAYFAAAGALSGLPLGRMAMAHDVGSDWPNLATAIQKYIAGRKVPNMIAGLGWGQNPAHSVGGGKIAFGSDTDADLDSLYRIYSMTKPITGMAAMMLIEDGVIGLDQPVADILPAFADMRVLRQADGPLDDTVPAAGPITIRHLLTHTAGLGYDIISKGPLQQAYAAQGITSGQLSKMPIPGLPNVPSAPGLEAWADRLATLPLIAQPGTKWSYSCSLDLMGRVIEVATGMTLDAFLQSRVFDPCGMTSTWFSVPASEVGRLTDNYGVVAGFPVPVDPAANSIYLETPPVLWGGSGLVSSPRDYDRFLRMLLGYGMIDGTRVMGEGAVRIGTSNILPQGVSLEGTFAAGEGFGAGGRSVDGTYGWGGAAGTLASVSYKVQLRSTLFTQYMPSEAYPVRDEFLAAFAKDLAAKAGV